MQQAPSRRHGSAAAESAALRPSDNSNSMSRSQSANRRAASLAGAASSSSSSARSGSQPKQRGGGSRSASTGKGGASSDKPQVPSVTPAEAALAKMKKAASGKTDEQLEMHLQQLLQQRQFEEAAYLIAVSPTLEAKYKTSDVIRLLLDVKQFDKAAQLIRDMKLQSNQLLVTLFIKELVRASLFQAAVRYSQELVQNFGKHDFGPRDQARPSWTPQALIQAMIRAQQFRSALKYAKQFELLDMFPPAQLIASMFEARSWDEAVSSVLEFRLFQDFPLELLVQKLLEHRQWSNAVKCINKLSTQQATDRAYEMLVRETARVGDFVTSLRYLREFKLDQPDTNSHLLKYFVDCTIAHGELYKAIKYSIKFGLNMPPPDAEETGEMSVYDTELLIRKAIVAGQFHVAEIYIKKLKLKDRFAQELEMIQQQRERMLHDFHQFVAARAMQYSHPQALHELSLILGDYAKDEQVEQVVETELVLSIDEEIVPRKPRTAAPEDVEQTETVQHLNATDADLDVERPRRASRFSFAQAYADAPLLQPGAPSRPQAAQHAPTLTSRPPPPPGLAPEPATEAPLSDLSSASTFNFAHFAAALQPGSTGMSGPPGMGRAPPQQLQQHMVHQPPPQGVSHLFPQHQASQQPNGPRPGGFYPLPPPQQQRQFGGLQNQHGYTGPPPPPPSTPPPPPYQQQQQQQQPPMHMFFQSSPQHFSHAAPPPPPPPLNGSMPRQYHGANSGNPSGSFDVSSLAMQFHARPQAPGFVGSFGIPSGQFGQGGPPPPPMPPGMPAGLFPSMGPPPQAYPPPPPPQPQFSFKPSVSYTSVTKKA